MKYRYGWKLESEIEYYTNFLGKQDFLSEEDMLNPEDKTRMEKEIVQLKAQMDKLKSVFKEPEIIQALMERLKVERH